MSDEDRSGGRSVLVVGGTGRTGREVIAELRGRDVPVTAIVRSPDKLPRGATAVAERLRATVHRLAGGHQMMGEQPDAVLAALRQAIG